MIFSDQDSTEAELTPLRALGCTPPSSTRNRNVVRPDPTLRVTVRRSLRCADGLSLPAGIDWINLRASGDIIAHGGLVSLAPAIQDEVVNNGVAEPHAASRYLSRQTLADTVTKAASL